MRKIRPCRRSLEDGSLPESTVGTRGCQFAPHSTPINGRRTGISSPTPYQPARLAVAQAAPGFQNFSAGATTREFTIVIGVLIHAKKDPENNPTVPDIFNGSWECPRPGTDPVGRNNNA